MIRYEKMKEVSTQENGDENTWIEKWARCYWVAPSMCRIGGGDLRGDWQGNLLVRNTNKGAGQLFPFDGRRRFGADVVDHAVYAFHFIDDIAGDARQEFVR